MAGLLPRGDTVLSRDNRIITSVFRGDFLYTVGRGTVDHIYAYDENGSMAPVPWIAIVKDGKITVRFPAEHATGIVYGTSDE